MKKSKLVVLAVILSVGLILGCGGQSSPSASVQGNVQEARNTGTVEGRTWYTDTDPNPRILMGVHFTFSSGGQTYSTDSIKDWGFGWYSIELPASSEPGISYTVYATAENCQPYEGEVSVVTGASVTKDIVFKLIR